MLLQPVILGSQNATGAVNGATTEPRIRINRPDDENARCRVSRVRDQPKNFSQPTQPLTTLSTSNAISPPQKRTEPSGPRRCRRGATSSLRREPDMQADLLRALFGNVTVPPLQMRSELCRNGLLKLAEANRLLQWLKVFHIQPDETGSSGGTFASIGNMRYCAVFKRSKNDKRSALVVLKKWHRFSRDPRRVI